MRLLLIAPNFPPAEGGANNLYYEICKRLNPKEIIVLAEKQIGWKEFDKKQKFKIYRLNKFSHLDLRIINELIKTLWIIKKEKIDKICFGHINQNLTALILKKVFKKDYFLYAHGEEISSDYGGKYYAYLKKKALKNAKKIVTVSNFTKKELIKLGAGENQISVVYNAVNRNMFKPIKKDIKLIKKLNLKNKKILLTVARLENRKGHDSVIKSLTKIKKQIPNIIYLIIGRGPEENKLKELVNKLNLNNFVKFLGYIPNNELVKYYNLCDVFIMPNKTLSNGFTEGFGIVFLEANACGKPVIGGNAGGVPDAIKNRYNGFLVNGNNIDEISGKIIKLLKDNRLNEQMCRNGREWVKNFNYIILIKKFLKILK